MNLEEYALMYEAEDSHWWYVGLHKLVMGILRQEAELIGRPLHIFDAGCGTGRLCQLMEESGHMVKGCDSSEEALRFCRERGCRNIVSADLNSLELEPGSFDIITAIDVLYHLNITDDVQVMRRLLDGLRPGGMLIVNSVAHEFLRGTHDMAVHTRERYTRESLSRKMKAAGFHMEKTSYRVSFLLPFVAIYRLMTRALRRRTGDVESAGSDIFRWPGPANCMLLKILEFENLLLKISSLPAGSSIFIIARRPADRVETG